MCGRGSLTKQEKELEERFDSQFYSEDLERYNPLPNFNIAPTQVLPIITQEDPGHFLPARWGLVPSWSKDAKIGSKMINARVEGLGEKSFFKSALLHRRCLVPMDGFYEWCKEEEKIKLPYRIGIKNFKLFSMAGIYDYWKDEKGNRMISFSIITLPANAFVSRFHERMPAILLQEEESHWIDSGSYTVEQLTQGIKPYPDEDMEAYRVSTRVNSVKNNDESLILPLSKEPKEDLFS